MNHFFHEWLWSDFAGFVLFGAALVIIFRSNTTSAGSALVVPLMIIMITQAYKPVEWLGVPIFPGQFYLAFSCVALAAIHARLGPLAAHRVWRIACVSVLLCFLIVSRFLAIPDNLPGYDIGEHYTLEMAPKIRLWASVIFLFVFIGGIGQVIWKVTEWEGWKRYLTTLVGFPAASVIHSFIAFYGNSDLFWERTINSALCSTYAGAVLLGILLVMVHFTDNTPEAQRNRVRKSARELNYGGEYPGKRSNRSVSSAGRKQNSRR